MKDFMLDVIKGLTAAASRFERIHGGIGFQSPAEFLKSKGWEMKNSPNNQISFTKIRETLCPRFSALHTFHTETNKPVIQFNYWS